MTEKPHYSTEFDAKRRLVLTTLVGDINVDIVGAMAVRSVEVARQHNCRYCLIDYSQARTTDSTLDVFKFASRLSDFGVKHTDVIAVVVSRDLEVHDFADAVSFNRGYQNIRYFTDRGEAFAWINMIQAESGND